MNIVLQDSAFAHCVDFLKNTSTVKYERRQPQNSDIILNTMSHCRKYIKGRLNISWIIETFEIEKSHINFIINNLNKYDIVLTCFKELIELDSSKFHFNAYGTSWMHDDYIQIYDKSKICSIVASNKKDLIGHKLRHIIANKLPSFVDRYGPSFINLPNNTENIARSRTNGKILSLSPYMFSIIIENDKRDYYFTEKLIDCFLTGTIPIYWGCPSIGNFFNIEGMIFFDTCEECLNLMSTLTPELYNSKMEHIRHNFETAQNYKEAQLNTSVIIDKLSQI
jgi:hypothetical protein